MALCLFGTRQSGQEMSICILVPFTQPGTWQVGNVDALEPHPVFITVLSWGYIICEPLSTPASTVLARHSNCDHFITPSIFLFLSIIAHPREVTKVTPSCPDSFCNHLDDSQSSTPPTVMSALATHLRFPRP